MQRWWRPKRRMDKVEFSVAYDGPALAEHTMDASTLGPALQAMGDLFREANRVLNGPDITDINVRVKATEPGCFNISFELQQILSSATEFLQEDNIATAKEIAEWLGLLGGGAGSLIALRQWLRGRKQKSVHETTVEGSENVVITVEGNDNKVVYRQVFLLLKDRDVQSAQRRMLSPLEQEGVEEFQVREGNEVVRAVKKKEIDEGFFDAPTDDEEFNELVGEPQTLKAILVLRAPVFVEGNKWQFFYGDTFIHATISDQGFLERVFVGAERFGNGDQFEVRMCITQVRKDENISNEYEILEVMGTKRGPSQSDWVHDGTGEVDE